MYGVLLHFLRSLAGGFPQHVGKSKVGSYFCSPMVQVRYAKDMLYSLLPEENYSLQLLLHMQVPCSLSCVTVCPC